MIPKQLFSVAFPEVRIAEEGYSANKEDKKKTKRTNFKPR